MSFSTLALMSVGQLTRRSESCSGFSSALPQDSGREGGPALRAVPWLLTPLLALRPSSDSTTPATPDHSQASVRSRPPGPFHSPYLRTAHTLPSEPSLQSPWHTGLRAATGQQLLPCSSRAPSSAYILCRTQHLLGATGHVHLLCLFRSMPSGARSPPPGPAGAHPRHWVLKFSCLAVPALGPVLRAV